LEMRSWQQRALAAAEQVERLSIAQPYSGPSEQSIIEKEAPSVTRKSRIELPSSQIPISVKRAVDFYSSMSQRSDSLSPSPTVRTPSMIPRLAPVTRQEGLIATTTQGPVSNGNSYSAQQPQQQQPSQIPRLVPDWIQQQLMLQGGQQQQREVETLDHTADDADQLTAGSSLRLQQLPAAAATTSSYTAAESETEVPILPFHEQKEEGSC